MLETLNTFLKSKSSIYITCICLLMICLIGVFDHLTGYEISFSIFYLLPISIGAWYAERNSGFILCYFSAIIWYVVDYSSGHRYSHQLIPYWNTLVRAGFFVLVSFLISLAKDNYEIEKKLARVDGLTGLLNLRAFIEVCDTIFRLTVRTKRNISICYIDVDNFKALNDTHGHSEGDHALKEIATTLKQSIRKSDSIGRLGGDEFAILLFDTDLSGAKTFMDRILERLKINTKDTKSRIGFSVGVGVFSVAPSSSQAAIMFADSLMYRAKRSGGNQIVYEVFKPSGENPVAAER